jgi:molecular chaperone GrpE
VKRNNPFKLFNKNKKMNTDNVDTDKKEESSTPEFPTEEGITLPVEDAEKTTANEAKLESSESEKEIEKLKTELATYKDKYVRLIAEFENYKKRTIKEKIEDNKLAGKEIYLSLLPVLDDIERAMKSINSATDIEALKKGVNLIYTKFKATLESKGVKEISSVGEPFNTDHHEAITSIDAPSEELKGKVVDELEKGYWLHDKIIRFAKVIVGK